MKLTVKAPAKINWSLSICGERPDGYHELDTIFYPLQNPADELDISFGADAGEITVSNNSSVGITATLTFGGIGNERVT